MPEKQPDDQAIFEVARNIESSQARVAYVTQICAGDVAKEQRINALLATLDLGDSFLESPPTELGSTAAEIPPLTEGAGSQIGPFKLLQQIGEGGMGAVYMAEQIEPVERRVALKIIKPGMDTRTVIARFEAERQALAMMDHPNIARVLDVGTTNSGRPYFVMELVRGVPVTQYCDEHQLTPRERLELFLPVCQAVQHAHQKGIIHRDIKPSNVLVAEYDDKPVPKIIDFGLAKAMEQRLTAKTMFTEFGQVVGTPDYMSPEQAKLNQMDIDTRSDIYSLGVLLYELLSGNTPFDRQRLRSAAFDELLRIIREEEPPKPSQRLSTVDTLPSIAANRHITPAELTRQLSGELDWIVMKTLEKDRSRRYETANGLAADLHRYLADEPVLACPPSAGYRFRKFARRNKGLLATTGMIAAALLLGAVLSTWQAVRATRAERLADARLDAEVTARAAESQQRKVAEDQRREAEKQREAALANFQQARKAVDEYFTLVSESTLLDVPGLQPLRRDLMESALRFYQQSALDRSDNPEVLADLAVTHLRLSQIYTSLNRNDDCIAAIDSALDAIDHLHRAFPRSAEYDRRLGGFWRGMRWSQASTQMPQDPQRAFKTLVHLEDTWQQLADKYPSEVAFRVDQGPINAMLGALCVSMGQPKDGIAFFRKATAIAEQVVADEPNLPAHRADLAIVIQLLANVLFVTGDVEEAEMRVQQAVQLGEQLVIEEPNVPAHRHNLAQSLTGLGGILAKSNPEEAEKAHRRGIELHEALATDFPAAFLYHERLNKAQTLLLPLLISQGRDKDVEQLVERIRQSLVRWDKANVDYSFKFDQALYLSRAHVNLGKQLQAINRPADAVAEFGRALEIAQNVAADSPNDRRFLRSLGHSARIFGFHLERQSGRGS